MRVPGLAAPALPYGSPAAGSDPQRPLLTGSAPLTKTPTALLQHMWAVSVLPKIQLGPLHYGGFGIILAFDGGSDLGTCMAHGRSCRGSTGGLAREVELFASLDISDEGVDARCFHAIEPFCQ